MDFFKLIKSLDELVYEVLSWLLFYPVTLLKVIRHPIHMMLQAERELEEDEAHQFDDALGPPLFLFLTIALVHILQLIFKAEDESIIRSGTGIARYITDDTNFVIFQILVTGLLPLTAARRMVLRRGARLDKNQLRPPFYAQCYATAVFSLLWGGFGIVGSLKGGAYETEALVFVAAALAWLVGFETRWFSVKLGVGFAGGLRSALIVLVEWLAVVTIVGLALGQG